MTPLARIPSCHIYLALAQLCLSVLELPISISYCIEFCFLMILSGIFRCVLFPECLLFFHIAMQTHFTSHINFRTFTFGLLEAWKHIYESNIILKVSSHINKHYTASISGQGEVSYGFLYVAFLPVTTRMCHYEGEGISTYWTNVLVGEY